MMERLTMTGRTRTRRALLILAWMHGLLISVSATPGDDMKCGPLVCKHQSMCLEEAANFESHRLPDGSLLDIHSDTGEYHCSCPSGWTGLECDVAFESCEGTNHTCYHGGNCVVGLIDKYDNDQLYCNCDNAWEGDTRYAGKYCEHKSISMCDPEDTQRFCLNGGTCNDQYPAVGKSCICEEGYKGPHCEYKDVDVPDCTLDCQNGGHCILGTPSEDDLDEYSGFWNISEYAAEHKQFCRCQDGWYGRNCEIPGQPCGEEVCFHGSQCTQNMGSSGKPLHHCDCRFSNDGSFSYAGRFCQYKATVYCDKGPDAHLNGHLFCVNNGTCQEDTFMGCVCPTGYRGFSCEYFVAEDLLPEETDNATKAFDPIEHVGCSLECNGRGSCRDGIKDTNAELYGSATHLTNESALASEQFEHCVCQDGWTGLNCEHQVTDCAGGAFHCFHGGKCFTGGDEKQCDCSTAQSKELGTSNFKGDQCQHPATDICTIQNDSADLATDLSFCVNYGTCKKKVAEGEPHPGCTCDETKWTGPHCEVKVATQAPQTPAPTQPVPVAKVTDKNENDDDSNRTPFQIAMVIVIVLIIISFAFYTIWKCFADRRKYMEENVDPYARRLRENSQEGGYRDEPDALQKNLAPRRVSSMMNEEETRHLASSSRDPFASQLVVAPQPLPREYTFGGRHSTNSDSGPQVYLGPPKDEDGNVLHSVEIL